MNATELTCDLTNREQRGSVLTCARHNSLFVRGQLDELQIPVVRSTDVWMIRVGSESPDEDLSFPLPRQPRRPWPPLPPAIVFIALLKLTTEVDWFVNLVFCTQSDLALPFASSIVIPVRLLSILLRRRVLGFLIELDCIMVVLIS